jgi:glycosyltransferase involved in cell wall biosynthesis
MVSPPAGNWPSSGNFMKELSPNPILIVTNFQRFPRTWNTTQFAGTAEIFQGARRLLTHSKRADVVLVNGDVKTVLCLAGLFWLFPFLKKPLVAVDLVLRQPEGLRARLNAFIKKCLFARVDHFIHYFRDLERYQKYYGIDARRSSFVNFKANLYERFSGPPNPDGDYVLCFGQSLRDYDSFFKAMAALPYRAAIPKPDFKRLRAHGSQFSRKFLDLTKRLTLLEDDGTPNSQVRIFEGARIVTIPILRKSLCASGIGTYLNAMWMGKCVVISEGPGVSDVLSDEAIIVPPEDPESLKEAIQKAWEDTILREKVARSGRRLAESLGGEQALLQRVLNVVVPKVYELKNV